MNDQVMPPEGSGSKSLQTMKVGGSLQAIYPQSVDEVYRVAQMAIVSGVLKPVTRRVKRGTVWTDEVEDRDSTIARGSMIVMQGMEIGMPPLQALQLIALINGRLTVHSEGVPALLWSHGFKVKDWFVDENGKQHDTAASLPPADAWHDRVAAYCRITRPDGSVIERAFSVAMAKTARLWDRRQKVSRPQSDGKWKEFDNDSAWHRFPDRLLIARARGFASKDGAADAMRGMMVSEEALDIQRTQEERERDTVTPIEAAPRLALPFDIDLDLEPKEAVPVREQKHDSELKTEHLFPNGVMDIDVGDEVEGETRVEPDDDQELSRQSEARLVVEVATGLAAATSIDDVVAIERSLGPHVWRISDDTRDALIEQLEKTKEKFKTQG